MRSRRRWIRSTSIRREAGSTLRPMPGPGAVDEQMDAGSPNLDPSARGTRSVPRASRRGSTQDDRPEEIDEQVLVRERTREPIEADGAGDRLDDASACVGSAHVRRPRNSRRGSPSGRAIVQVEAEVRAEELDLPTPALGAFPEMCGVIGGSGPSRDRFRRAAVPRCDVQHRPGIALLQGMDESHLVDEAPGRRSRARPTVSSRRARARRSVPGARIQRGAQGDDVARGEQLVDRVRRQEAVERLAAEEQW